MFDSRAIGATLVNSATSLFNSYSPVKLTPAGSPPVQATLPPTRTGTPAQDPIVQNGLRMSDSNGSRGLFSGSIHPAIIVVGAIVAVAAIVMIARR